MVSSDFVQILLIHFDRERQEQLEPFGGKELHRRTQISLIFPRTHVTLARHILLLLLLPTRIDRRPLGLPRTPS